MHPDAQGGYEAGAMVCQGCKSIYHKQRDYARADDEYLHLNRYVVNRKWVPPTNGTGR